MVYSHQVGIWVAPLLHSTQISWKVFILLQKEVKQQLNVNMILYMFIFKEFYTKLNKFLNLKYWSIYAHSGTFLPVWPLKWLNFQIQPFKVYTFFWQNFY